METSVENVQLSAGRSWLLRYGPILLSILALALVVRGLTANFIQSHFDDPGWFQFGSYAVFDRNAQDILDGRAPAFWINDPTRTDKMSYPPGYPLWMAFIYRTTGERSPASMQRVQWVLDSFAVLLLVGIGTSAFGWRAGAAAGFFGALSPLLALSGVIPTADAPTSWVVLGAIWCLILAVKKKSIPQAIAAGCLLGAACWFRVNPLFLIPVWAAAIVIFTKTALRRRILLATSVLGFATLVISPVIIRNLVVFYPEVAPTGLNVGWNMLAGIGETELGKELGVPCCDVDIVNQDRIAMNLPDDAPLALNYPDGIRRDRERGARALAIIADHPVWFVDVMANRTWGHLKFAGTPVPNVGSPGVNVTPSKTLSPASQSGPLAWGVTVLGSVQSIWRYLALPLIIIGVFFAFKDERVSTLMLLSTIFYYLATLAIGHSEIRYGLPMQAALIVFAGVGAVSVARLVFSIKKNAGASLSDPL